MGRYTKAYTGTLAVVCAGAITVAVRASEKASKLGELDVKADRWQAWANNERLRDERAYARYNEVAKRYRRLARQVDRSQRRLLAEIAATRSLHRTVVTGTPIITYVRVRRVVPVATAPAATAPAAATGAAPTTAAATKRRTATKPRTTTKPKTATPSPGAGGTGGPATGTNATADTGSQGAGSASGSVPPAPANPPGGTPPPAVAAPVNTQLPSIVGQPQSGKTFSADPGSWTGNPTSFTYQWQRCDAAGANCVVVGSGQSYTCVPQDIDKTMRVAVEAKNAGGTAIAVSAPSPKTKPS